MVTGPRGGGRRGRALMVASILQASQNVGEAVHGDYVGRGLEEGQLVARVPESADSARRISRVINKKLEPSWGPFREEN